MEPVTWVAASWASGLNAYLTVLIIGATGRLGWIDDARLEALGQALAKNGYGRYLLGLLREPTLR